MNPLAIALCCIASASAAFNFGVMAATYNIVQAEQPRDTPPAGDQFSEGPVLVRLPSANAATSRFIF